MKSRNSPVGTCPCPIDAAHVCDVFQFAARAKTDTARRKAGKFYLDCRSGHGRLGFDGSAWIQEHVLETITWHKDLNADPPPSQTSSSAGRPATTAQSSAEPSAPPSAAPSRSSEQSAPAKGAPASQSKQTQTNTPAKRPWWEDIL